MISDFSEPDGYFVYENFMSNEEDYQTPLPALAQTIKPGGIYIGVGPEQNFTYIAAFKPEIAFIIDIRKQNMLEHLLQGGPQMDYRFNSSSVRQHRNPSDEFGHRHDPRRWGSERCEPQSSSDSFGTMVGGFALLHA